MQERDERGIWSTTAGESGQVPTMIKLALARPRVRFGSRRGRSCCALICLVLAVAAAHSCELPKGSVATGGRCREPIRAMTELVRVLETKKALSYSHICSVPGLDLIHIPLQGPPSCSCKGCG